MPDYSKDLRIARLRADQIGEGEDPGLLILYAMQAGAWISRAREQADNLSTEEERRNAHSEVSDVEQLLIDRFVVHARRVLRSPGERRRRPRKPPEPLLTEEERAAIREETKRFGLAQATGAEPPA